METPPSPDYQPSDEDVERLIEADALMDYAESDGYVWAESVLAAVLPAHDERLRAEWDDEIFDWASHDRKLLLALADEWALLVGLGKPPMAGYSWLRRKADEIGVSDD